jgi:hypothetical protein
MVAELLGAAFGLSFRTAMIDAISSWGSLLAGSESL